MDMPKMEPRSPLEVAADNYPIMQFFKYQHLPPKLQEVSAPFAQLAVKMAAQPRNAETSAGLRKLLEAKDCAVRAAL
jgi:hypothetical protein